MIARELFDVDVDDAVGEALHRLRWFIRATASYLSDEDPELAEDLEQEAGIALWKADPTRFDVEGDDEMYLHGLLFKTMQKAARRERRKAGGTRRVALVPGEPGDEAEA